MKKRLMSLLLCLALCAAMLPMSVQAVALATVDGTVGATAPEIPTEGVVWDGSVSDGFQSGSGTRADPYQIATPAQLAYLAYSVNSGTSYYGKYIILCSDIFLNDTTNWESWPTETPANTWTPIGDTETNCFSGTFDGKTHTIYGIYIVNEKDAGLFGFAEDARIQNLAVADSYLEGDVAGGIVANLTESTISLCINTGKVAGSSSSSSAGGIVGSIGFGGAATTIASCRNEGEVSHGWIGGIVGEINNGLYRGSNYYIENCSNFGALSGGITGGIIGYVALGEDTTNTFSLRNNTNGGTVIDGSYYVGGIVGYLNSPGTAVIEKCNNSSDISGKDYLGGICGWLKGNATFSECYNRGSIYGFAYIGGVLGYAFQVNNSAQTIKNCFNLGNIDGESSCGGILGDAIFHGDSLSKQKDISIDTSYSVGEISGYERIGSIAGSGENARARYCYYLVNSACDASGTYQCGFGSNAQGSQTPDTSGSTIPLYPSEMSEQDNFVGFNFESVWAINDSWEYKYPTLVAVPFDTTKPGFDPNEYSINGLCAYSLEGEKLDVIPTSEFWLKVSITHQSLVGNGLVLIATYTAEGQYIGMMAVSHQDIPRGGSVTTSFLIDNSDGNIGFAKAFVVESFSNLAPLGSSLSFPAQ